MKKATGFTLIEILIALSVFVILATITSSSLYYAFTTRSKVNAQADRLNGLQLAISILEQDTLQMMDRAVRSNEMRLFPNFIGLPQYMEYTRGGVLNPKSAEKRSTLKRIALACQKGSLVRRSWDSLDPPDHQHYHEKVLINHINECHFNYLNQNLQTLPE